MKIPTRISFSLFFFIILSESNFLAKAQNTTIPVNVGVILDFDTWSGKMGMSCINMALADFYASNSNYKTRLVLNSRDSKSDVVGAAVAALDLIKNVEVQAIIGPRSSMQANFVIDLGDKAHVPIISFSATSSSLTSLRSPYFFRVAQNDSSQVKAISAIIQAFGWREVVPIYIDNEYGQGIIPFLIDALQDVDVRVPYRSVIPTSPLDDQIGQELYKLKTMQTRVFIVHMLTDLGSRLFTKAKEFGLMSEGYVWIMTSGMTNSIDLMESSVQLENFTIRWKTKFQQHNPTILNAELNVIGLWAYDATLALADIVEKVGTTNFNFEKRTNSSNLTDLKTIKVLKMVQNFTKHYGFHLDNGQLQSSTFQIINVNGNGERVIAFWTPENGLVRTLNSTNTSSYSTSKKNLGPIIWPGDSSSVPKGWEIPTSGKKLRIGVPVKDGFSEFVKVTHDPSTNTTQVTGYSIDVFNTVMEALPYVVSYEFIPFAKPNGESASTYDEMVYRVYLGNFDAVAGDTTIIANRSNFVDFTLPYTKSGVTMVVPIKDNENKNAWVFLKPLTLDLWITSGCFFVFIGFVVWVLEHRINEEFRGPPLHEIGASLWYSFSTLIFAQRETVVSNLTRFVVIIWLQPTLTDVNQLIKSGEYVGYEEGSYVLGILKEMKFDETKLKAFKSPEECDELLLRGSANGGIAAAIDDIPCMKLLLEKYCSKYTMVESIYKTNGLGFVFPKGSPLVSDVSRAILNVIEGEKMKKIERAWLGEQTNCQNSNSRVSYGSLNLKSFWGLFLIVGIGSLLALIISISMFLHKERGQIFIWFNSESSIWNLSMLTFRKTTHQEKSDTESVHVISASDASPNNNYPPSPSSCSVSMEPHSAFSDSGTPPREYCHPNPNGHTFQLAQAIELIDHPNQVGPRIPEIAHENC
ncbi:glutamate receptor 2.8-like [Fagus crenata]